ncbi:hypothetical protein GCM10009677_38500 [Sphaerisporangium rubeum]|uniref:Uncharacterized protein n=1 Tax=Sphaerisporangium rubeum TaxID=321317 RepID=A0A7X0ICN8_9ACTN|nr:hypothetical protein [Sphaerisporangium rubeum]MBB6472792.1 hypothetical protein [Sphaerisporangium rubeum]
MSAQPVHRELPPDPEVVVRDLLPPVTDRTAAARRVTALDCIYNGLYVGCVEKEQINVRLPKALVEAARREAQASGTTVTRLITEGLVNRLYWVSEEQAQADREAAEQAERKAS